MSTGDDFDPSQPTPPPPPPDQGGGTQLTPVGAWPRLGARIIDGIILFVPNLIIGVVVGADGNSLAATGVRGWIAGALGTALTIAYFVFMETSRGQTLGKMALGQKVVGPSGGLPTTDESFKRNAWLLLGLIPILGGLATLVVVIVIAVSINRDSFNRGRHDEFAGGTAVVKG